ncbi:hypothetical protein GCM10025771_20570 [Niveibacterium umoris]|uniref:Tetratricopeptide (TPR) repeat protein n=1 Tax=Niveibacterium umoris TaxID=1193620 RepID=A0A840BJF0_9RHOO|nr:tetratricopeptide repeat protein [Niveibacterium umoris]MBB4012753.1 tetratricopeptide (TPR) repeat protein [Niveibacterium umoris]
MSLLIDALRKAEANRQQAVGGANAAASEVAEALSLEPIDLDTADLPPAAAPAGAYASATKAGQPRLPSVSATAAADEAARRNARQLFNSKPVQRTSPVWWAATGALIIAAGGVGYVWLQTQPRTLGVVQPPARAVTSVEADHAVSAPIAQSAQAEAAPPAPPVKIDPAADPVRPGRNRPRASGVAAADGAADPVVLRAGGPATRSAASTAIEMAYGAYERGELALARSLYQEALRTDPRAADALNGLAATALRQGQPREAEQLFSRALQNNPQDAVARAGMLSLGRETDPMAAESRLKGAIAETPGTASNHFALGNLQAASGRWNDAQQSYFSACTLEPDNPDYLFNLAVALDRINQPRLARQYYERALSAAEKRPAAFDKQAALRRAQSLAAL